MSSLFPAIAAAGPMAAAWAAHTVWLRRRLTAARRDPLTGLAGRDEFEKTAGRMVASRPLAVVVIDLDGFKALNDTHGHAAGDAALAAIGRRLARWADENAGTVARLGGDEFAAAAPVYSPAELAWELARVHEVLCAPLVFEGRPLVVGASIGAAWSSQPPEALPRLLRRADEAMYAAKRSGGGWRTAEDAEPLPTVNGRRAGRPGTHGGA
ncbi:MULTISPECIES: GGDEF domain-containing protein [Streptomyces]|uniref:GGDEF domain-containing protein n=2 Tax=Streptomyces TaxID=1883 RepID=A0A3R7FT15_9ACTN|nr:MULTISPECIES: GGDEF domain-containing protein [Streptomyces]KNE81633.1 diguanylate cyclase [Streptomyces fradiae]OFA49597.1 diguanylate cyclase [Streptomyces fradiae]PQM21506.1 GGDEF domain-containing protein [Streptomyces xinghaiensis]RKM94434.1 GGDEF domain-containing protein [Streptomyces xinghaiensis]RNC72034.1 GGDEF domain-containing protein [Streptomyces xinghaiensis]